MDEATLGADARDLEAAFSGLRRGVYGEGLSGLDAQPVCVASRH
jgi:hypothetical protein